MFVEKPVPDETCGCGATLYTRSRSLNGIERERWSFRQAHAGCRRSVGLSLTSSARDTIVMHLEGLARGDEEILDATQDPDFIAEVSQGLRQLAALVERGNDQLAEILRAMVVNEDRPCSLDHHGHCQEHGWFDEGECGIKRARELLGL